MNLKSLNDRDLLNQTQNLVNKERNLLTSILHHLREVERRKLFSDLGYQSLFEYSVRELKYSEGQAGRRIQAMRLLQEIPELEQKIENGDLNLTNISQAQSYFREAKKQAEKQGTVTEVSKPEKKQILESLENKSSREGQKILIQLQPEVALPKDKERVISENHLEVRWTLPNELKEKIEALKSLMGQKATNMSWAELIDYLVTAETQNLKAKKFGKKRSQSPATPAPESQSRRQIRYISKAVKHKVWTRDQGKCVKCSSQRNLNWDHIRPVALGGKSSVENLRILCSHCNQRQAIKGFGIEFIEGKKALNARLRRSGLKNPD